MTNAQKARLKAHAWGAAKIVLIVIGVLLANAYAFGWDNARRDGQIERNAAAVKRLQAEGVAETAELREMRDMLIEVRADVRWLRAREERP